MTSQAIDDKLETPREIAAVLRTTPQTVLNYHRAGIIPARISYGRMIRFDRQDVLAALAARSRKGEPAESAVMPAGRRETAALSRRAAL